VMSLLQAAQENPGSELLEHAHEAGRRCAERLAALRGDLDDHAYPFEHADGEVSIGRYAVSEIPAGEDPVQTCHASESAVNCLISLYFRVMGELATTVERVEVSLGLERPGDPTGQLA
jgi:hypothetical protein